MSKFKQFHYKIAVIQKQDHHTSRQSWVLQQKRESMSVTKNR